MKIKEKLIVLLVSVVLWFLFMPLLTKTLTMGLQLFTFIPMILITIILYKIIEKIFHLEKIKVWIVIALSFVGWLLSVLIFIALPNCGQSSYGWGSWSIDCDCKGMQFTLDTSAGFDSYGSNTVCLGLGKSYLGNSHREIVIESCRLNNCPNRISLNVDFDSQNETINCKTGVISEETYTVNMRGSC